MVFKTILRKIRKEYLKDFNEKTKYIKQNRNKKPQFLVSKLTKYAQLLIGHTANPLLEQELVFFMGALFYPKHLKTQYDSSAKHNDIDIIHSALYQFSLKKLAHLEEYGAYCFLVSQFLKKNKQQLIKEAPKEQNIEQGISQLQMRLRALPKTLTQASDL